MLPRGLGPAPTAEGVPWADGGAPGHGVCFPALGATSAGCTGCGATARVDEGAQRAPHPNGLSVEEGGGGQGSAGGCLASRGHPQLHWSARGCAGLGVCDEVGGARAHLEVPWAGRSRDTHSGQAVSPSQPPLLGPEGADSVHPSRRGRRLGGGGVGWWMGLPVHLCGRGGPPAGLPCGSQIPTYLSLGVRSLRDLDHHVTACSEGARACGGGGGGCWACFRSGPISVGGGGGSKRSAPLFPGPQEEPAHGLHPRFVVAEIWADTVWGGGAWTNGNSVGLDPEKRILRCPSAW